jgi:hypothetical protein
MLFVGGVARIDLRRTMRADQRLERLVEQRGVRDVGPDPTSVASRSWSTVVLTRIRRIVTIYATEMPPSDGAPEFECMLV